MKLQVMSVYDVAVKAYLSPFYTRSLGEAIRTFTEVVNTKDHQFNKHSADYALFHLGTFDDASATFEILNVGQRVVTALEVLDDQSLFPPEKKIS